MILFLSIPAMFKNWLNLKLFLDLVSTKARLILWTLLGWGKNTIDRLAEEITSLEESVYEVN